MKIIKAKELTQKAFNHYGYVPTEVNVCAKAKNAEITYWDKTSEFNILGGKVSTGICECYKRDMNVIQFERHICTTEMMLALDSDVVIVFGRPDDKDYVNAFIVRQGQAVLMKEGCYHWSPFPFKNNKAQMLVVFKEGTPDNDLEILPLSEEISIVL